MTQTSVNNEFSSDLSVNTATSARDIYLNVQQTDNTNAASHAVINLTTGGASGGNPQINISNSVEEFSIGLDNADSDCFKIAATAALETATTKKIASGLITRPLQPAFNAYLSATVNNVTGNGALYGPIIYNTEKFDIASNYNTTTGTFTAPVSGNYFLAGSARLQGCVTSVYGRIYLTTSDWSYSQTASRTSTNQNNQCSVYAIAPMDAGDTAYCTVEATGEAGNVNDINANPWSSYFCGALIN